jgi:hypothetical protein
LKVASFQLVQLKARFLLQKLGYANKGERNSKRLHEMVRESPNQRYGGKPEMTPEAP